MGHQEDAASKPWLKSYDNGVPHSISYPATTLQACLEETSARYPDRVALSFLGKNTTYGMLVELVNRFAASLQLLGVSPGDRVVLLLPNSPQFVIAYYGVLTAGAVVVPANPLYVERELLHLLEDSGANTVITLDSEGFLDKVDSVRKAARLKHIIAGSLREYLPFPWNILFPLVRRVAPPPGSNAIRMRDMMAGKKPAVPVESNAGPDDVAVIAYTGGTTGVPKGACLTHRSLIANVLQCCHWFQGLRPASEIFLAVSPVFHAFSMTTSMNLPLFIGGTVALLPKFDAVGLLQAINKYRPTLLICVPAIFNAIIHNPELRHYDMTSLRLCVSGADALPAGLQQEFEDLTGCRLIEGYGLTEASPVVTCNPAYGKRKGIGLPLPDTVCRIVDTDSRAPLPAGEDGELLVRGPQVMSGYWHNPGETAIVLRDGWLYTGDIARMDEGGYFEIIGRKKDIIKVQRTGYITAYKVYPTEVEGVLLRYEKVQEAAIIGAPDPIQGERIVAYVVLRPGVTISAKDLTGFCRRFLAEYKVPSQVEFVDVLPKNRLGKVLRKELRQRSMAKKSA